MSTFSLLVSKKKTTGKRALNQALARFNFDLLHQKRMAIYPNKETILMPAFCRTFDLGTLYNAGTEEIIPSK